MRQSEQSRRIPDLIKERSNSILKTRGTSEFFGIADEREGHAIALKFTTSLGAHRAIHYHDILSPIDYNGTTEITLSTTRLKIIITGRNLDNLFDHIIQHQVKWIREPQSSFSVISDNGEVEVSLIRFEEVH